MSMHTLFETQVKIGIEDADFKKGVAAAGAMVKDFASSGIKALGSLTGSFASLTKDVTSSVKELAVYGDHIDKQSQKMNMSAKAYQEWDAILKHSGTSIDSMQASIKTLSTAVESGDDAFATLGMSLEEVQQLSGEDLFAKTITALQNVEDDTQRTYLAGKLLGRGATELGALLNTSAEDTELMRQRVHELGGVMSDTAVKDSAAFQDSLQDMQTAISGLKRSFAAELLPSFKEVMDGITEVFAGEEGGENKIEHGITQAFNGISKAATKLKPVISRLGNSFFNVIQSNIPQIVSRSIQLTSDIATEVIHSIPQILNDAGGIMSTISENIPQLAGAAKLAITSLAGYLKENLPVLIPEGVNAVVEFAKGLTDPENSKVLIDAAFDVVDGLIEGLTSEKTINAIIDGAPVIVDNLVTGIVNVADRLGDAALKLSTALVEWFSKEENQSKLIDCGASIVASIADGFIKVIGTGAGALYNFGGVIAENIGLGEYWEIGNKALTEWWDGFKAKFPEFKEWFRESIKGVLSFDINDSTTGMIDVLTREIQLKKYADRHGSLEDRKKTAYHANGAIITEPLTTHVFGEAGREAVLPLDSNTSWMDKLADRLGGRFGGRSTTVNIYHTGSLNEEADFDRFVEKLDNALANRYIGQERAIGLTI